MNRLAVGLAMGLAVSGAFWAQTAVAQITAPGSDAATDAAAPPEHVDHSQPAPTHTVGPKVIVHVDLTAQQMHVTFPDGTQETWPIASGRPGLDTPAGHYKPQWIDPDHVSKQYQDAPMPYAVFFDLKGHAFHGSYQKTFGRAVSHGCVRLPVADAKKLFEAIKVSSADIEIAGQAPRVPGAVLAREDASEAASGYGVGGQPPVSSFWGSRPVAPPRPQASPQSIFSGIFGGSF